MGHNHSVYDSDVHFTINAIARAIKNDSPRKSALIQHDHNSERFTFRCPRFIEGHDMSTCNKVEVPKFVAFCLPVCGKSGVCDGITKPWRD